MLPTQTAFFPTSPVISPRFPTSTSIFLFPEMLRPEKNRFDVGFAIFLPSADILRDYSDSGQICNFFLLSAHGKRQIDVSDVNHKIGLF